MNIALAEFHRCWAQ